MRHGLALGIVIALTATLRFRGLDWQSLWWDEGLSIAAARHGIPGIIDLVVHSDFHPPEYYILLHAWMATVGSSPADVRLLSAVIGVIGVVLVYFLGRHMFNARTGLMASAIVAGSQFHLYYSQETRSYILLFAVSVAATHAYWLLFQTPERKPFKIIYYVGAATLLLYAHFAGIFVVIAHAIHRIHVLVQQPNVNDLRFWLATQAVIAALFAPWLLALFEQASRLQGSFWIPEPTLGLSPHRPPDFSIIGTLRQFIGRGFRGGLTVLLIANAFLASRLTRLNTTEQTGASHTDNVQSKLSLLAIWILCSMLLPFVQSLVSQPIYVSRLVIPALAPLCILAGVGLSRLRFSTLRLILLAILLALALPDIQAYYSTDFKERWDAAVSIVEKSAQAGDVVVISDGAFEPWLAYAKRSDLDLVVAGDPVETENQIGGSAVWLVSRQGANCTDGEEDPLVKALGQNRTLISCQRIIPSALQDFPLARNPLYVRHFSPRDGA